MTRLPTVYLDTSLLSALHYSGGSIDGIHFQAATREWWDTERRYFKLYASNVTEEELRKGEYSGQKKAIAEVLRLTYLPLTKETKACAERYIQAGLVPKTKRADAFQLALASVYKVDYLLTWNYAHLASPSTQERVAKLNQERGLWVPWLVSPETIPRAALGQTISRRR